MTSQDFLDEVVRLDVHSRSRAIDYVYDCIDNALLSDNFEWVNSVLDLINAHKYSISVLLSFLTVTRPSQNRLSSRVPIFNRIKHRLTMETPTRVRDLLEGLE